VKRLKAILSGVLEISENEISDETSPDTVEMWDSFNALMLVSLLEKEFNVKFSMKEVSAVKCVGDIKESLRKHGIILSEE